ncbi:MAG TPA: glucose 1-dehydrogenase [Hyphomicrobiales bacterium]|nr:glucose 1-dehydrogenase [Hyphomicrobiales bacterium]
MRAITVLPGTADSAALGEMPEPAAEEGTVEVEAIALGICGTDAEIVSGAYGWAPPGQQRLILGHESLGRVRRAPADSGLKPDDLVVGIVRRPDPVPCPFCAVGEWDMCRNGRYTERGIKERDGYGAERWRIEPDFAVKVDPALGLNAVLLEPTSVVAKAWDHAERLGHRSAAWKPKTVLVTGAGPVGLLAALIGAEKGLDVHVFDRVTDGPKPGLVKDLGGTYHAGSLPPLQDLAPDIIIECTGATAVIAEVVSRSAPSGIVCLAGVSSGGHEISLDLGGLNRTMVLENDIVFGSVNANRRHYQAAAEALAAADKAWLGRLITRRVRLDDWKSALAREKDDVKVVVDFAA